MIILRKVLLIRLIGRIRWRRRTGILAVGFLFTCCSNSETERSHERRQSPCPGCNVHHAADMVQSEADSFGVPVD